MDIKYIMKGIIDRIDDIHLYINKNELLVKDIIWAISWIGGIYTINKTAEMQALASAYLIFSLSLLMEFGLIIKTKNYLISRVISGLFSMAMICILLMSIAALLGAPLCAHHYEVMYDISFGIMVFMAIDFVITWIEPDRKPQHTNVEEKNVRTDIISEFEEKLYSGYLGNLDKGESGNE